MSRYQAGRLSYLKHIPDEPEETHRARTIAQLRQALIDHPEDELPLLQQLMLYLSLEDNPDEAIGMAWRILEIDKDKEYARDAYCILARIYSEKGEVAEAVRYYNETIRMEAEESKRWGFLSDESIMELGELYEKQKDWDNALQTYDLLNNKLIDNGKENMNRLKGRVYMLQNNWEKASECFDKAIDCCLKYEWVERHIGNTYIQDNMDDGYVERLKEDIGKDYAWNNPADVLCRVGLAYQDKNDYLLAMHYYTEALKLKPFFAEAYNNMAKLAFDEEGDLKKSITLLHKARECAEEEIKAIEKSDENAEDEINSLETDKEGIKDEEAVKEIDKKIKELNTRIYHNESKTEHYVWLKTLTDLNLSRVYNKMTDFKLAAHYKQKFVENMGFSITDVDDEDEEGEW